MATEEYGNLAKTAAKLNIKRVGLTATPDNRKKEKDVFYLLYCPIIYEYHDSAKDGIVNKRKYIIYEHTLNDMFEVEVKAGKKRWMSSEKKQYQYVQSQVEKGEELIREILNITDPSENVNYFGYAKSWYLDKSNTVSHKKKNAGGVYIRGVSARKDLLWNLNSTAILAELMVEDITNNYKGKVLIFSERTEQANKIATHTVHSGNTQEVNEKNIELFNSGVINNLGSCYSLTLGLNLKDAKYAVMESFNGSSVQFKQRSGRVDRLPVDEDAIVTFIVVKDTQSEVWFNRAVHFREEDEVVRVDNILDYTEALKNMH